MTDWREWHRGYDDPGSPLSLRMRAVQEQVRRYLDTAAPGPLRVLSLCSGLGLDLVGALPEHARGRDVSGVLVELDDELCARSRELVAAAGLDLEVRRADAGDTASYADAAPVDLLLLCGIFGNVSDADVERTVRESSRLCAPGAAVVWTRHRRAPDLTPSIRRWWTEAGWEELAFDSPGPDSPSVGVARLVTAPLPYQDLRLFAFGD